MPEQDICEKYEVIADWFEEQRNSSKRLMEKEYLDSVLERLPARGHILDLGCGTGRPIAEYFINAAHKVTGVDRAPAMIEKCRCDFPDMNWFIGMIQDVDFPMEFDAIIAWDSTFHMSAEDQRAMFSIFSKHIKPGGFLLFTSGPGEGEASGEMNGLKFDYASLTPQDYRRLLDDNGFEILKHIVEDPNCGSHTVWLAQYQN